MNRFTYPFTAHMETMGLGRGFSVPAPMRFTCGVCKEQRELGGRRRYAGVWHCRHCARAKA